MKTGVTYASGQAKICASAKANVMPNANRKPRRVVLSSLAAALVGIGHDGKETDPETGQRIPEDVITGIDNHVGL